MLRFHVLTGEAKCVPGFVFFFCFRVLHVVLDLPGEAYATCSPWLRVKNVVKFTRHIKKI